MQQEHCEIFEHVPVWDEQDGEEEENTRKRRHDSVSTGLQFVALSRPEYTTFVQNECVVLRWKYVAEKIERLLCQPSGQPYLMPVCSK